LFLQGDDLFGNGFKQVFCLNSLFGNRRDFQSLFRRFRRLVEIEKTKEKLFQETILSYKRQLDESDAWIAGHISILICLSWYSFSIICV
jgi:hypothetical protein